MILYKRDGTRDSTWKCIGGVCDSCDGDSCETLTVTVSTSGGAASSAASLPSNPDCTNGDIVRLASPNDIVVNEIAVIGEGTYYTKPYDLLNQYI